MSRVRDLKQELEILNGQLAGIQLEILAATQALKQTVIDTVMNCNELKDVRWRLKTIPSAPGAYVLESDGKPGEPADILELTDRHTDVINLDFCTMSFVNNRLHLTSPDGSLSGIVKLTQRLGYKIHPESLAELRAQTEAVFDRLGETALPKQATRKSKHPKDEEETAA